jgi:hypothetical protein
MSGHDDKHFQQAELDAELLVDLKRKDRGSPLVGAADVVAAIDFQQARVAEIERRDQARLVVVKQGDGDGGLRRDLANILNHHCLENESDTPDFILANYLAECLKAFDRAVLARDAWYDEALYPGRQR